MRPPNEFFKRAHELEIEFEPGDLDRLGRYLQLVLQTNREFNLTSITDPDEAWIRHIFDSLTLLPYLMTAIEAKGDEINVIDVGSGAGLPGIPLAVVTPGARMVLLEATGKKARFLERVAEGLSLQNVAIVHDRAENAGQDHNVHREKYDQVISRAVGRLSTLLELTIPLAKVGGLVLAIKGAKASEEIAEAEPAFHMLHAAVIESRRTPTGTIVAIEKLGPTPRRFPRSAGEPKRSPLR